ncbi:hypothetical protein AFLA70_50g003620 [Aspergillus flavus AF70]|nr:hypothetical protein AFLA70_50g003620 [Aspergillus flavus AF70]
MHFSWWGTTLVGAKRQCFSLSIRRLDFEPLSAIPDTQPRCFDLSSITPSNGITRICVQCVKYTCSLDNQGALLFLVTLASFCVTLFFFSFSLALLPWLPWRHQYPDSAEPNGNDPRRAAAPVVPGISNATNHPVLYAKIAPRLVAYAKDMTCAGCRISEPFHIEPAVYHAANMLGAVQEDSEENSMRLAGVNLHRPRHRFALEQSARSFALLHKRHASHDPQFKEVTLVCCLLFTLSELLLGQYDTALQHLRSGLQILNEAATYMHCLSAIDQSLVEAFVRLDAQSSHFGKDGPLLHLNKEGEEKWSHSDTMSLPRNVQEARRELNHVLSKGIPFLSECWSLSKLFCEQSYAKLSPKEQRGVDIIRLHYLAQILSIKTCFFNGPIPGYLTPEYVSLLSAHEALMAKFPERSTTTLDNGIIPGLYVVASKCPDYRIRLRAIKALQSWPHCEGLINSNIAASLAFESLKRELMQGNKDELSLINMLHTGQ